MYWDNDASIERTQKAVSRDAKQAMSKNLKQELAAKTPRRERPTGVPKRGRMMRQVLQVPTSRKEREIRALVVGLLFWIIGGAIALFAAGMPPKGAPPPEKQGAVAIAFVIGICLGVVGALLGWFVGVRKPVKEESEKEDGEEEE